MRIAVAALLLVGGVARAQGLQLVIPPSLGGQCDSLDAASLVEALEREQAAVARMKGGLQLGAKTVAWADYAQKTLGLLAQLAKQGTAALCAQLPKRFDFYRNVGVGEGHFTIYYHPVMKASRTRHGPFQHPIYRRPSDGQLAALTTAQVIAGGLQGKGLELAWLDDPTAVNAIHVEGSATLQLDDGSTMLLGSDGHNGQPYVNFGKLLAADNKIPKDQVTPLGMTRARKYFIDHPAELWVYWAKNPHYVFFKEKKSGAGGKFGDLVAGRSLAVDPAHIPLGAAVWFRTDQPILDGSKVSGWSSFGRVGFAQDTGSGIKGAGRVDMFFGSGDYAQAAAQVTGRPGEIYVLVAK
jgi:membrane-bound lytic murein transglycosylase A